jgi:protoporphyrinogen oxidase
VRVAVVGAGASGLAAAYRLSRLRHECDVYERRPYLGGQAATIDLGGYRIERCPQYMRRGDDHVRTLLEEVGLGAQVDWRRSSASLFAGRSPSERATAWLQGRGSTESLGYPRSSWEVLWGTLAELIEEGGGRVLIDRPVKRIARAPAGFVVCAPEPRTYDAVVATLPAEILDHLLEPDLAADWRATLTDVGYRGASSLLLELDRPLTTRHRTRMTDRAAPFAVIVEQTNFIEAEHYGGRHFAYVVNHFEAGDPFLELDADALLVRYEHTLQLVRPGFSAEWVRALWRFTEPHADVVTRVAPATETGTAGLLIASTAHSCPGAATIDAAIALGQATATRLDETGPPNRGR